MSDVSPLRLHLLRASYLLIAVGLGVTIWPLFLQPTAGVEHMRGVVRCLLAAISLLAIVGVVHPLRMLPLLLLELLWKGIWLVAIGLPLRTSGQMTPATSETWGACLFGVVLCAAVIPWGHVRRHYLRGPGRAELHRHAPAV